MKNISSTVIIVILLVRTVGDVQPFPPACSEPDLEIDIPFSAATISWPLHFKPWNPGGSFLTFM